MADSPTFNETLRHALGGVNSEEVRIFYDYFDDLKRQVRRYLGRKARNMPGESAIAQSAMLSLFCNLKLQQVPLSEVDEYGSPMLGPLLLKYVERHCNKWNKYYQAKKRKGNEVPIGVVGPDDDGGVDPVDYRGPLEEEERFVAACDRLQAKLSAEERAVVELRLQDKTLEEIAAQLDRAESTVSNRLKRIRAVLLDE